MGCILFIKTVVVVSEFFDDDRFWIRRYSSSEHVMWFCGTSYHLVLNVLQVCLEGDISKSSIMSSLSRGKRAPGELIPWTVSQQVSYLRKLIDRFGKHNVTSNRHVTCLGMAWARFPGSDFRVISKWTNQWTKEKNVNLCGACRTPCTMAIAPKRALFAVVCSLTDNGSYAITCLKLKVEQRAIANCFTIVLLVKA